MKTLVWIVSLMAGVTLAVSAQASNLIVDGNFSTPDQSGGWSIYANGSSGAGGWMSFVTGTSTPDGIEIGASPVYGLPCISTGCQNLEVNANNFDTDSYTVNGLTIGSKYLLSYDYGGRTSGGPDSLEVFFGGALLTTDTGSVGSWTLDSFIITATATTETLVLESLVTGGLPSYGNEITNLSLTATPLPATWTMLIAGFVGVAFFAYRAKKARRALISST